MFRNPSLHAFLSAVRDTLAACELGAEATLAIDRIHQALASPGRAGSDRARRLPVCEDCLSEALEAARRHSPAMARIADAFAVVEPALFWAPRGAGGPHASANWSEGHANAMIIGPRGLETRNDVHIGASLLAPRVRYPDHSHGPEEVYLVLSPGRFQHGELGWLEPGIGGTLYNEPNIRHAMASDEAPLLALWCLWTGNAA